MESLTDQPTPALIQTLIRAPKRLSEDDLNAIAAELLDRLGPHAVRRLALVAADRSASPERRIRALRAVRRIGVSRDLNSSLEVFMLLSDKNPAIREAAAAVIEAGRQEGTAQSIKPRSDSVPGYTPLHPQQRRRGRLAPPES